MSMNNIAKNALLKLVELIRGAAASEGIYPDNAIVGGRVYPARMQVISRLVKRHDRILARWPFAYGRREPCRCDDHEAVWCPKHNREVFLIPESS